MKSHNELHHRPFIGQLVRCVYSPKFRVKSYAPWFYAGETKDNYFNYRMFQTSNLTE